VQYRGTSGQEPSRLNTILRIFVTMLHNSNDFAYFYTIKEPGHTISNLTRPY